MLPLLMAAAPYLLQGASMAGGIFGKKRKHVDPEYLRQKFGPHAVSQDTTELANYLLNSPYGQKLMASAAESGQSLQNNINARSAAAGFGGGGGADSGSSVFATGAGAQAQSGFERATKGDIYQSALPIAAEGVAGRQQAYLADTYGGGYQDDRSRMAEAIGQGAGLAASMQPAGTPQKAPMPHGPQMQAALTDAANYTPQSPGLRPVQTAGMRMIQPTEMQPATSNPMLAGLSARRRSMHRAFSNNVRSVA